MTPQTKKQFQVGVLTALAVALVLFLATEARESVVMKSEYDLHVQSEVNLHRQAALMDSIQSELLRDVLCSEAIRPTDRRCR